MTSRSVLAISFLYPRMRAMHMVEPRWPSTRRAWVVTGVLTFAYTVAFLHRIGLSLFVEPIRRDLGLTDTQIGLLTCAFFAVPYTLSATPLAGWMVDHLRRVRVLAIAAVIWSIASGGGVFSYASLIVGRVLACAGQAVVQPASALLIADAFPPAQRATGFGVFVAGMVFGTAAAYLAGALALALGVRWASALGVADWQAALMLVGALGLLVPIAMLTIREPIRRERSTEKLPTRAVFRFVRGRARVLFVLFAGVALTFLAPYGLASCRRSSYASTAGRRKTSRFGSGRSPSLSAQSVRWRRAHCLRGSRAAAAQRLPGPSA